MHIKTNVRRKATFKPVEKWDNGIMMKRCRWTVRAIIQIEIAEVMSQMVSNSTKQTKNH
jgi:hypothetical protein